MHRLSVGTRDGHMGKDDKLRAPADFDGPVKDRKCTDILFTLAIIIMWITMTAVGIASVNQGDVEKLLAPIDYDGNLCGWDSGYEDLSNLYYVNGLGSGICIESCPSSTDLSEVLCRYDVDTSLSNEEGIAAGYCLYQFDSTEVVNYCVFTDTSEWENVQQSDLSTYLSQFIADIITARGYVFGFGFGIALTIAFLYIGLLQIPYLVASLVWSCVLLVLAGLLGLGFAAWVTAADWDDAGTKDSVIINAAYGAAVVAWVSAAVPMFDFVRDMTWPLFLVLAFLWVCLFCFLAKRISLAIGVIKEAGRAIACMPLIVFWPVVELIGSISFVAIWMYYAAYTASLGDITTRTPEDNVAVSYKVYEFDQDVENRGWFLIFCLFWTLNFITAIGQIVIAMSVSAWYFARNKSSIGSWTVVSSAGKTIFFHLGTAAFGALIIAIIEFIQAVLSYINKKAKASGNKVAEWISCCCMCCFWCLENCMRFINENAYVQTAIFSSNFCTSARKAFYLIARNIARVAAVSVLGEFVLTIMTLFVTIITAVLAYWAMDSNIREDLHSIVGPTIMTAVLAYYTGKMITGVYGMAITTILQCFVADEELFPASQQFAENDLKQWVDRNGAAPMDYTSPGDTRSSAQQYAMR